MKGKHDAIAELCNKITFTNDAELRLVIHDFKNKIDNTYEKIIPNFVNNRSAE
jgi:hypothetical protein